MFPVKTILHPTDFSPASEYALRLACAFARDYGAALILLHVHEVSAVGYGELVPMPPEPPTLLESLKNRLRQLVTSDFTGRLEHHVAEGDAASEILRFARESKCDLIVMGTHGRTGLGRLLVGSVAETVMRKAPCPVVTVKEPAAATAG